MAQRTRHAGSTRRCAMILLLALLASFIWPRCTIAGSLLGPSHLDRRYCQLPTFRQTIVYIDDSIIVNGSNSWALQLNSKLRASLMPGERVTIVRLSPASGTSREMWSGCWPDLTASERHAHQQSWLTSITSGSVASQLEDQKRLFSRDINRALVSIYVKAHRLQPDTRIQSADAPKKRIIEALASDAARYSVSDKTNRVIIYSDLAQNSQTASVFSSASSSGIDFGKELGVYFPHTLFYFYGVGSDISGDPTFMSADYHLWRRILASMSAALASLGSTLAIPNRIPVASYHYGIKMDRQGQTLYGKMWLLTDSDGHLVDSWLSVSQLWTVPINGTFVCRQRGGCSLRATTVGRLTTSSNTESIVMNGLSPKKISGTDGVPGAVTIPVTGVLRTN